MFILTNANLKYALGDSPAPIHTDWQRNPGVGHDFDEVLDAWVSLHVDDLILRGVRHRTHAEGPWNGQPVYQAGGPPDDDKLELLHSIRAQVPDELLSPITYSYVDGTVTVESPPVYYFKPIADLIYNAFVTAGVEPLEPYKEVPDYFLIKRNAGDLSKKNIADARFLTFVLSRIDDPVESPNISFISPGCSESLYGEPPWGHSDHRLGLLVALSFATADDSDPLQQDYMAVGLHDFLRVDDIKLYQQLCDYEIIESAIEAARELPENWKPSPTPTKEDSIKIIPRISAKKIEALQAKTISALDLSNPEVKSILTNKQFKVAQCIKEGREFINPKAFADDLLKYEGKMAFVDFEFIPSVVLPKFGPEPGSSYAYQWAAITKPAMGWEADFVKVKPYLALDSKDRRVEFLETLYEAMTGINHIFVWHKSAEEKILNEYILNWKSLGLAYKAQNIKDRLVDLKPMVCDNFVSPEMRGKEGLKNVAEALGSGYSDLNINSGTQSLDLWTKSVNDFSESEVNDLLSYCQKDVEVMNEIVQYILHASSGDDTGCSHMTLRGGENAKIESTVSYYSIWSHASEPVEVIFEDVGKEAVIAALHKSVDHLLKTWWNEFDSTQGEEFAMDGSEITQCRHSHNSEFEDISCASCSSSAPDVYRCEGIHALDRLDRSIASVIGADCNQRISHAMLIGNLLKVKYGVTYGLDIPLEYLKGLRLELSLESWAVERYLTSEYCKIKECANTYAADYGDPVNEKHVATDFLSVSDAVGIGGIFGAEEGWSGWKPLSIIRVYDASSKMIASEDLSSLLATIEDDCCDDWQTANDLIESYFLFENESGFPLPKPDGPGDKNNIVGGAEHKEGKKLGADEEGVENAKDEELRALKEAALSDLEALVEVQRARLLESDGADDEEDPTGQEGSPA